jgi:hypothetical protein
MPESALTLVGSASKRRALTSCGAQWRAGLPLEGRGIACRRVLRSSRRGVVTFFAVLRAGVDALPLAGVSA